MNYLLPTFQRGHWLITQHNHPMLVKLYERHYSANKHVSIQKRMQNGVSGPGEAMCLLTLACDAGWIWGHEKFRLDDQEGVQCRFFRNEGPLLSSILIEEAVERAWERWPNERLWTYINPSKIRSSNPGFCFQCAGWHVCGKSKGGLVVLEMRT